MSETNEPLERAAKSFGPPAVAQMPPEIAEAIFKVKAGIQQLGFDERNEHGRYGYASVDKFYVALRPLEIEAGLEVILDEVGLDVRAGDSGKGWAFIDYEIWLLHKTGVMWGPLRRHIALPVTGAQTFGAAESYIHKAFRRGFYMVPTGETDGDETPRHDAPTKGPARPMMPPPGLPPQPPGMLAPTPPPDHQGRTVNSIQREAAAALVDAKSVARVNELKAMYKDTWAEIDKIKPAVSNNLRILAETRIKELAAAESRANELTNPRMPEEDQFTETGSLADYRT